MPRPTGGRGGSGCRGGRGDHAGEGPRVRRPDGRQRKEAVLGTADCPACGNEVELFAETEVWHEAPGGRWVHAEYGPAMGVCCGKLIVDGFDDCRVYDLPAPKEEG